MQSLKTPLFTVFLIFLGLFIYTKLSGPIPFFVNSISTTKTDEFLVSGEGKATAIPDTANISLGITTTQNSIASVQNQTNSIINKIASDLKKLGINDKDIQTTNYSINPNYNYSEGNQRINGYTVSANIAVKVTPIDKLNQAIDLATKDGANTVGGIQFTLNDEDREKLEQKARKEAISNAKKKAQMIASVSGITLGRIINVSEAGTSLPRPLPMFEASQALKTADSTQIEPGQSTITSSVTLSYEIR